MVDAGTQRVPDITAYLPAAPIPVVLTHIPMKWAPVRRQEYAPIKDSGAYFDSEGTKFALETEAWRCPCGRCRARESHVNFPG
jgi:hypothetical protein